MSARRRRPTIAPAVEPIDARVLLSRPGVSISPAQAETVLAAYPSTAGQKRYNPTADLDRNGRVGLSDLRLLIRKLPPPRRQPLRVVVNVAPAQAAEFKHRPTNLGGHTFQRDITLVIRTTPGSLIQEDGGLGDYSFHGRAKIANARGLARFPVQNRDGLSTYNFRVIDPFGNQLIRSYPVYWLSRAYQAH